MLSEPAISHLCEERSVTLRDAAASQWLLKEAPRPACSQEARRLRANKLPSCDRSPTASFSLRNDCPRCVPGGRADARGNGCGGGSSAEGLLHTCSQPRGGGSWWWALMLLQSEKEGDRWRLSQESCQTMSQWQAGQKTYNYIHRVYKTTVCIYV